MADITDKTRIGQESRDFSLSGDTSITAAASIAKNVGDVAGTVFGAAGNYLESLRRDVGEDVERTRDELNQEIGVTGLSTTEQVIDLPPEAKADVERAVANTARYQSAAAQGKVSSDMYTMRLASMQRQLKVKYPGLKDEIESIVGRKLGFNPANKLARDHFAAIKKAESDKAASDLRWSRWKDQNLKYLPPSLRDKASGMTSYPGDQALSYFQSYAANSQANRMALKDAVTRNALEEGNRKKSSRKIMGMVYDGAAKAGNATIEGVLAGAGFKSQEEFTNFITNGPKENVAATFVQIRQYLDQSKRDALEQVTKVRENGHSAASITDGKALQAVEEEYKRIESEVRNMQNGYGFDYSESYSALVENSELRLAQDVKRLNKEDNLLNVTAKTLGLDPVVAEKRLFTGEQLKNAATGYRPADEHFKSIGTLKLAHDMYVKPQSAWNLITDTAADIQTLGGSLDPGGAAKMITDSIDMVLEGNRPPKEKAFALTALMKTAYGAKRLEEVTGSDPARIKKVYDAVLDPRVVALVKQHAPEQLPVLRDFMATNFATLYKAEIDHIAPWLKTDPATSFGGEKSGIRFDGVKFKPIGDTFSTDTTGFGIFGNQSVEDSLVPINRFIQGYLNALDSEADAADGIQELHRVLTTLRLPTANRQERSSVDQIIEAIGDWFKESRLEDPSLDSSSAENGGA